MTTNQPNDPQDPSPCNPKWGVVVDDRPFPMPRQLVPVSLVRSQASVPASLLLVRDHDAPDDVILRDGDLLERV